MKVPALTLSLAVGAALISPAAPARAGGISNLLGTAAETVQPGSGGVVRSGWGLLRGLGRSVIPRRRRSRSTGRPPVPAAASPVAAPPAAALPVKNTATFSRPAEPEPSQQATASSTSLTVADLLRDPPPPPRAAAASGLIEQP